MKYNPYEHTDTTEPEEDLTAKLEGRIRALEAVIAELPGLTPEHICAAKERVRRDVKSRMRGYARFAELVEQMGRPLDGDAEASLDELLATVKNR